MSGQAAQINQAGSGGVGGADGLPQHQQMQDVAGLAGLDPQFVMLRKNMREKIFEYIGRRPTSADWRRRLPELSRRLEEILFRKFSNKNDYYNMMNGPVEPQLEFAIKTLQQNQQMSRQIASSSGYGTMIPTPGITQGTSGNSRMPYVTDNTGLSSSGAGMVPQNASMGTSLPGSVSNGYQHLTTSVPLNSTTSIVPSAMGPVGIQRQVTHMIPTPGFNNQQNVPANPDYSSGAGYFNGDSAVAPHMQDVVDLAGLDPQFVILRKNMREKIFEYIGRRPLSADWRRRLPELSRRLEEILFRNFSNKNDYYNIMNGPVEPPLEFAIKTLQQHQQMSRQIASSSGYGTMIPTPGITQDTSGNSRMPYVTDSTGLSSSGAGMVPQNASMGSVSNGYQHLTTSVPLNSTTSSVPSVMGPVGIQQQVTHMIPTPGFNNQQNVPANPDYSNGAGYFNGDSAVAPHMQQQKQFPSSPKSHQIQHIGGHNNSGIHSSMLENSSAYGLSDGHVNGGMGLHGSNMQLTNRTAAPEAYMNISSYGSSPNPLQQQFNQHPPQRIPTSVDMDFSSSLCVKLDREDETQSRNLLAEEFCMLRLSPPARQWDVWTGLARDQGSKNRNRKKSRSAAGNGNRAVTGKPGCD